MSDKKAPQGMDAATLFDVISELSKSNPQEHQKLMALLKDHNRPTATERFVELTTKGTAVEGD